MNAIWGQRFKKLGRPLAVLTSYVAMIAIIVALFSFVLPQVVDSIQLFAASVSGYMVNLQAIINKIAEYLDLSSLDLSSPEQLSAQLFGWGALQCHHGCLPGDGGHQ